MKNNFIKKIFCVAILTIFCAASGNTHRSFLKVYIPHDIKKSFEEICSKAPDVAGMYQALMVDDMQCAEYLAVQEFMRQLLCFAQAQLNNVLLEKLTAYQQSLDNGDAIIHEISAQDGIKIVCPLMEKEIARTSAMQLCRSILNNDEIGAKAPPIPVPDYLVVKKRLVVGTVGEPGELIVNGNESITGNLTITGTINGNPGNLGTTDHAVQVGTATGGLQSLPVGTNGQVLLGATDADPAFANLTSTGGTISFTTGPNSLNLEAAGGGIQTLAADSGTATGSTVSITGTSPISTSASGSTLTVALNTSGVVLNGGQAGAVTVGSTTSNTLALMTNNINRLTINNNGGVTIATPTSGTGLTVNGGLTVSAGSNGINIGNGGAQSGVISIGSFCTGGINIGSNATTTPINIGNSSSSTAPVNIGSSANTVNIGTAATTINVGPLVSTGTITIGGSAQTGTITIGGAAQTGTITLGSSSSTNTVAIGTGVGATTVNIATGTTFAKTVNIANGPVANAITIGSTTGAASLTQRVGTGNYSLNGVGASIYSIGASTTSGTITIGGTAQTGTITLGSSTGTNIVAIGSGSGATTVNIAGGADFNTVNIAQGGTNFKTVNIATGAVANLVAINSGGAGTTTIGGAGGFTNINTSGTGATTIGSSGSATSITLNNGVGGAGISIVGLPSAGGTALVLNGNQLAITASSRRFKENIQGIGKTDITQLRPVHFNYKTDEKKTLCYGLIAEEVAEIMPGLVIYDKEGQPYSVKYHELPVLLLHEIKKLSQHIKSQDTLIAQMFELIKKYCPYEEKIK